MRKFILTLAALLINAPALAQEPAAPEEPPEWITKGGRVIDSDEASEGLYEEAVRILQKAVDEGNKEAAHFLGRAYLEGKGVETDKQNGYALVKYSADEGNYAIAQGLICKLHMLGQSFPKDLTLAKQYCLASAQQGWLLGQRRLAQIFQMEKDDVQAAYWYELSALQGDVYSMHMAALYYMSGRGVQKNALKAAQYLEGAANLGDRQAQFKLGFAFYQGDFLPKNDKEALRWYRKAAANNVTRGQLNYGMMHWGGMGGIRADTKEAYKWMVLAAKNESCKYSKLAKNYKTKLAVDLTNAQIRDITKEADELSFDQPAICE